MHTLLLLGGRSERFWPLKEKPLFTIAGRTLAEHQINRLSQAGCRQITIVGSAENTAALKELLPQHHFVVQNPRCPGMHGALLAALPELDDAPVLIVSGNDVIDPIAYQTVVRTMESDSSLGGAILAQRTAQYFPGGYLTLQGNRITGIVEKPGAGNQPSDLVNIVVHAHRSVKSLLTALTRFDGTQDDAYEQALQELCLLHPYYAIAYEGPWQAVKYPWHPLNLLPFFLQGTGDPVIDPTANIHPSAIIEGPAIIAAGAKLMACSIIRGPCYIGPRTVVANNALVRGSSIGTDSVVGFCTEVKDSILGNHVWTHMNYVGDSIIADNVSLGAGTMTGNFRLDEGEVFSLVKGEKVATQRRKFGCIIGANVRIGIQTGLSPGVKIGGSTMIGSGCTITEDIPHQSYVVSKGGVIQVRQNTREIPLPGEKVQYQKHL